MLPVTERLAGEILSLPLYPELGFEQVAYVAEQVNQLGACPD
jgi:dTDP-4-amino-4,6-dideoxygalactose transaminase